MILDNGFEPDVRVYKEAKYLVEQGHQVEILALDKKEKHRDRPLEVVDGITVRRFFCRTPKIDALIQKNKLANRCKKFFYLFWFFSFIRQLRAYLKQNSCEYLHCHDLTDIVAGYFANPCKAKLIFDMHELYTSSPKKAKRWMMGRLVRFFQNRSDYIIYLNEAQKQEVSAKNQKKLVFLPNYPDANLLKEIPRPKHKDSFQINYIGAVRAGLYPIFRNLCLAVKDLPTVEINIWGWAELESKFKELETLYSNFHMRGAFDGTRDSEKLYAETDLLCCMYGTQNLNWKTLVAVKFMEAIQTATPVIVSRGSVMGEIVEREQIGFVVDENEVEEIKKIIQNVLMYPEYLKNLKENMRKIKHLYQWESIAQNFYQIYKGIKHDKVL